MPKNKLDWGDVVAILFFILGILSVIGGLLFSTVWAELSRFLESAGFMVTAFNLDTTLATILLLGFGVMYILIGYLVAERYKEGKVLAFIFGILFLFAFPVGTVIGLITLYTILASDVKNEFVREIEI